jgi:hypothetical protein
MAFLRKFNAAEGGPDRMDASEFETADPNTAIQRLIEAAKDVADTMGNTDQMCPHMDDLPCTRESDIISQNTPPHALNDNRDEPKISGTVVIMKLRKTAELLKEQNYQHRNNFTDAFQKLATVFTRPKGYGPEFETFEKNAFYKWGTRAVPYLQLLRESLRKKAAEYDYTAMAKVARVIDSNTPEMKLLRDVMDASEAIIQTEQGIKKANAYLDSLKK